jgi:hypothetical protein
MGFQPNVFNSIPGDPKYTSLWRVNLVEWKTTDANCYLHYSKYSRF